MNTTEITDNKGRVIEVDYAFYPGRPSCYDNDGIPPAVRIARSYFEGRRFELTPQGRYNLERKVLEKEVQYI